jgi:uncharacterized membrane protein
LRDVAEWLRHTPLSVAIWSALWLIRLLQATHLLTAGVACVSGLVIALRALGWLFAAESFDAVWRRFAPWLGWSFIIMLATGIAQTLGDPVREFTATSYWLKLALVLGCMTGTLLLGHRLRGAAHATRTPLSMKLLAAGLILCWLLIPMLGRMIAYDKAFWGSLSLRA